MKAGKAIDIATTIVSKDHKLRVSTNAKGHNDNLGSNDYKVIVTYIAFSRYTLDMLLEEARGNQVSIEPSSIVNGQIDFIIH